MNDPIRVPLALLFLILCAFVASKANSDEPPPSEAVSDGAPQAATQGTTQRSTTQALPERIRTEMDEGQISQWAWAGILWSDANLVRSSAEAAASSAQDSKQREKFYKVADHAEKLVVRMEELGWKRVARPAKDNVSQTTARTTTDKPQQRPDSQQTDRSNPAISSDAGAVETADIDQYRVNDLDEPPREMKSLAQKVEDRIEKAVAASDDRAIAEPYGAHISNRETQTRSNTLPYSVDSIYDADDFDQDGDYYVDNEKGKYSEFDDEDLDETVDPVRTITPDVAEVNPEPKAKLVKDDRPDSGSRRTSDISQYTDVSNRQVEDARWVQLHISSNQMRFDRLKTDGVTAVELKSVIDQLRVHLSLADEQGLSIGAFDPVESLVSNE